MLVSQRKECSLLYLTGKTFTFKVDDKLAIATAKWAQGGAAVVELEVTS